MAWSGNRQLWVEGVDVMAHWSLCWMQNPNFCFCLAGPLISDIRQLLIRLRVNRLISILVVPIYVFLILLLIYTLFPGQHRRDPHCVQLFERFPARFEGASHHIQTLEGLCQGST